MRKLSYLVIGVLLLGGCSYKNEAIPLESYKAQYNGEKIQTTQTAYLSVVKDTREVSKKEASMILKVYIKDIKIINYNCYNSMVLYWILTVHIEKFKLKVRNFSTINKEIYERLTWANKKLQTAFTQMS